MNDQTLDKLLKDADAALGTAASCVDVAEQVRRLDRRRRTRRRSLGGVAVLVIAVCTAWWMVHERPTRVVKIDTPAATVANLRAEIDAARADADVRMAAVKRMFAREKAVAQAGRAARADGLWEVVLERERAAGALLYRGDRYLHDMRPAEAAGAYRRILELFPTSTVAGEARKRLDEI